MAVRRSTQSYVPKPIATRAVKLPRSLDGLLERLAEHVHDIWARQRIKDGEAGGAWFSLVRKKGAQRVSAVLVRIQAITLCP